MSDWNLEGFRSLDWAPEHVNESLSTVYGGAIRRAEEYASWYFRNSHAAGRPAGILRL